MLIIDARESESIDRALKKYKKKFEKQAFFASYASARLSLSPV